MKTNLVLASIAGIAVASTALAQAPQAGQASKPVTRAQFTAQADAAFAATDTNHDGKVDLAELQASQSRDLQQAQAQARAALANKFKQLDTNHDGQLSLQEFQAIAVVRANVTPQQILQQLDTNHDGKVSPAEFRAQRMQVFDKLDRNHDGVITPEEALAAAKK